MSQPLRKKKLTPKEETFVKTYVVTRNGYKSALAAYDIQATNKLSVASAIANENLSKPHIQEAVALEELSLKRALIDNGVTPSKIALKINQLLDAEDNKDVNNGLKHATNIFGVTDLEKPKIMNTYNNFFFDEELRAKVKGVEDDIKQALLKNVQGD